MLEKYLERLVFKIRDLSHKYDEIKERSMPVVTTQAKDLTEINQQLKVLRRDVNDLHSMLLLRSAASKLAKKNRLVFLGTGQINENVLHAYLHFYRALQQGKIEFSGEVLFIARTQIEYDLVKKFGYPCELWKYQAPLAYYLLETKVVVLASHAWSKWGNCLLSHCIAGAKKIQLWHGLPAKTIGASVIDDKMNFHHFASLLEDSASVDHVCIQNNNEDVIAEYARAFPSAQQHVTGDCRSDILFNEEYRKLFIKAKGGSKLQNWLNNNRDKIKILYAPTFRETPETKLQHYNKVMELISSLSGSNIRLAIKLHVACGFTPKQYAELSESCEKNGFILADNLDEVYSIFTEFDAMIADYSSIRIDYALTGNPIFLWDFDQDTYTRTTDVINTFAELDSVSYKLPKDISIEAVERVLKDDPQKIERYAFVDKELKTFTNGNSAKRTIQVLLDVLNEN
ncbi:MAG: CDP-glycerol glycerophosphotransferase family protein [Staphylococcus chromogenes]|nr:CDP-glycerol glycerophosphotransferase family protein [Staphylococcus chromogenes]